MKLAVRIFAFTLVAAGAAAAMKSPNAHQPATSQLTASRMPVPGCAPGFPTCPSQPGPSVR